jgi:uroporphyrinogen-III decarboxylase
VDLIKEAGFDVLDCFASAPLVPFELAEARRRFGPGVTIWGGVPSTILCDPYTDAEFEDSMDALFRTIAPGEGFILGVSDNIMPETRIERVRRIGELVRTRGLYPVGQCRTARMGCAETAP